MNEIFPLERASEAYDRMMSGKARFRVVLTIAGQEQGRTQ
jgi:D-arabinose 1-dehydrogenase-like Zn-dependent alcohol dehydrogenase